MKDKQIEELLSILRNIEKSLNTLAEDIKANQKNRQFSSHNKDNVPPFNYSINCDDFHEEKSLRKTMTDK